MKYGNIFMCCIPACLNLNRADLIQLMKKYQIPESILPRNSCSADAFRAATNDLKEILERSSSPITICKEPDKGDMLIRSLRQKRKRGKAKTLVRIWFLNGKIRTRLSSNAGRMDPSSAIVQFKAFYNARLTNITKRQFKAMIDGYLTEYTSAVEFLGSARFIPAPELPQLTLLRSFIENLNMILPEPITEFNLSVTSAIDAESRQTLTQTLCNSLKREVWETREELLYLIETRSRSVPVISRKLSRAERMLRKLYTYRPICGPEFVLQQEALLIDQMQNLKPKLPQAA